MSAQRKRRQYITVSTEVDVDVYLDDIETEDLIKELQSRDVHGLAILDPNLSDVIKAFKFNQPDTALEKMRSYIENTMGVILS